MLLHVGAQSQNLQIRKYVRSFFFAVIKAVSLSQFCTYVHAIVDFVPKYPPMMSCKAHCVLHVYVLCVCTYVRTCTYSAVWYLECLHVRGEREALHLCSNLGSLLRGSCDN